MTVSHEVKELCTACTAVYLLLPAIPFQVWVEQELKEVQLHHHISWICPSCKSKIISSLASEHMDYSQGIRWQLWEGDSDSGSDPTWAPHCSSKSHVSYLPLIWNRKWLQCLHTFEKATICTILWESTVYILSSIGLSQSSLFCPHFCKCRLFKGRLWYKLWVSFSWRDTIYTFPSVHLSSKSWVIVTSFWSQTNGRI